MRTIIAGGRDYEFTKLDIDRLDGLAKIISVVLSGKSTGADRCGELWARSRNIPVEDYYPDWTRFGLAAGPIRNERMAKSAEALVVFEGGKGTRSMIRLAKKYKLKIFDFRPQEVSLFDLLPS